MAGGALQLIPRLRAVQFGYMDRSIPRISPPAPSPPVIKQNLLGYDVTLKRTFFEASNLIVI